MINVFFGESRVFITEELRQQLGWDPGGGVSWRSPPEVASVYEIWPYSILSGSAICGNGNWIPSPLRRRGQRWMFRLGIPGVVRGRLNGYQGVVGKVEGSTLVIDVRNLLTA